MYTVVSYNNCVFGYQMWNDIGLKTLFKAETKVWTNGIFDILHTGHLALLDFCHRHGYVIVGINGDESVAQLDKGHPTINSAMDRARVIASLKSVDAAVIYEEKLAVNCLELIKPEYFIKGGDYSMDELDKEEVATVESYGGTVLLSPEIEGKSTSKIWRYMDTYFSIAGNHEERV